MKVLIHAPAARMGGARSHVLGLVPELARLAPADRFLLLAQPDLLGVLPSLPDNWKLVPERAQERGFFGRLAWEQTALPRVAEQWGADVLLSFGSFVPLRASVPRILEAANALYFTRPYWLYVRQQSPSFQAAEIARWTLLQASLRASSRILVPSRSMRTDVATRLPDVAERIDVALWGVADVFHRSAWTPPANRVVLGVSKHGVNKEFDLLVLAIERLAGRWPDLRLLLTGTVDESRWSRQTAALVDRLGLRDRVDWAGDVPNHQVPDLLGRAALLVFPTWCESFGLPLAEALAMGAPAVAADIPVCREVGGEAARYYRPGDADSLTREMERLLAGADEREALTRAARERGRTFQWRENAGQVYASLARAAGASQ